MTLTINLPEDVGTALKNKAKISGQSVSEYIETLIAAQINRPTFRDLFADVRNDVNSSDEELEGQINAAVLESRQSSRHK